MSSVLQGTKETYQHWQREYEKYETKKKLEQQLKDLQRELTWRRIMRQEASQQRIQDRSAAHNRKVEEAKEAFESAEKEHLKLSGELDRLSKELETIREEHLKLEHGRGFRSGALEWIQRTTSLVQTLQGFTPQTETAAQANDQLEHTLSEFAIERERLLDLGKENETPLHNVPEKLGELSGSLTKNTDLVVESEVKSEVNSLKLSMIAQEIQE